MKEKFIEIVTRVAECLGYKLVEFYVNEKHKKVNIVIYKKTGITVQDCEDMTKELLHNIEFYDRFRNNYDIEVSSPGVQREFKSINEYKIFEGKEVKIITDYKETPVITGVLKGIEDKNKIVVEDGFKIYKIPYVHIKRGKLIFNFTF